MAGRKPTWSLHTPEWTCGNRAWRELKSYGQSNLMPFRGWAWEFLRRNSKYREAVDAGDNRAAGGWGLSSLVNYEQPFEKIDPAAEPNWLPLQAYDLYEGEVVLPALEDKQVAVIFDLRRGLRRDILQRQLGELADHLQKVSRSRAETVASAPQSQGGSKYTPESLLTYLRFTDAVAFDRGISSHELADALGIQHRTAKRLNEIHATARALLSKDYLRLVDLDLSPLRRTARRLKHGSGQIDWHGPSPAPKPEPKPKPEDWGWQ